LGRREGEGRGGVVTCEGDRGYDMGMVRDMLMGCLSLTKYHLQRNDILGFHQDSRLMRPTQGLEGLPSG
jgi:hypothetical protein